ncbi:E3 ubiquitin protein ligase DRIP [Parasponia andersonii]|uniref:E3 ubiquitin protein ligase DRIP n=1 Tax=Parasponia andersonii TaxID=3476 RepID=A0A2P5AUC0_PARAD|nr:E3 ubiquitin protein ligase DRIP [Parasponia andersonii]
MRRLRKKSWFAVQADHNLQDLRAKLFPSEIKNGNKANEALPSSPLPAKRKERSLSSLSVTAPRASVQPCMTGRRNYSGRKNPVPLEVALPFEKPVTKVEDCSEKSTSLENKNKIAGNGGQVEEKPATNESSKQRVPSNSVEDNAKQWEEKAVTKTNPNKANTQETDAEPVSLDALNSDNDPKVKVTRQGKRSRVHGHEKDSTPAPLPSVKHRKTQGLQQRKATDSEGFSTPHQKIVVANNEFARRLSPIWFSLIASGDQKGDAPLPQISSYYLRVEISLQGKPVISTLQLHNLVDLWRQTVPSSEIIQTFLGSSGKDFVMVLSYGRKGQSSDKRGSVPKVTSLPR